MGGPGEAIAACTCAGQGSAAAAGRAVQGSLLGKPLLVKGSAGLRRLGICFTSKRDSLISSSHCVSMQLPS